MSKKPGLGTGGPADYEQFAQEKGVGPRAVNKLKFQPGVTPGGGLAPPKVAPGAVGPKAPPKVVAGSRWFLSDAGGVDQPAKGERGKTEDSYHGDSKSVDHPAKGNSKGVDQSATGDPKNVEQTRGDSKTAEPAPQLKRGRTALIAEPGWAWSKSPSTVKQEWAKRTGSGLPPKEVYSQLLAEIHDHVRKGVIGNHDAHRAANEAFGRLLFATKPRKGATVREHFARIYRMAGLHESPKGHEEVYQDWAHQHGMNPDDWSTFMTHLDPFDERPGLHRAEPGNWDPNSDPFDPRKASKLAWSGWGPSKQSKHPKVAGWKYDRHLVAYIADPGVDTFTCKCGSRFSVPAYHNCDCGKVYNAYVIGSGGDRHEARMEKLLCREIETSPEMIVANRQADLVQHFKYNYPDLKFPAEPHGLDDEIEDQTPFPSDHHPSAGQRTINPQLFDDWMYRGPGAKFTPGHPNAFKKQS